jgi:hypothetical protein
LVKNTCKDAYKECSNFRLLLTGNADITSEDSSMIATINFHPERDAFRMEARPANAAQGLGLGPSTIALSLRGLYAASSF